MKPLKAVLLDRDGVLNVNRQGHVLSLADWEWLPQALRACRRLSAAGLRLAVVTNQAVVGRGVLAEEQLHAIHRRMKDDLLTAGVAVDEVWYCPHEATAGCACRKPEPGLLLRALASLDVGPHEAVMVGDHKSDLLAAAAAGVASVHVRTGRGAPPTGDIRGYIGSVPDLDAAAVLLAALA
ncbi:D-glycero-alpha-D-manno-heptose-1,7-bisphosphate 7-phosphatase [Streptomyces regalis]|uniref:D,D-heptose 1,7-bisphosphate phosphatase n=1 Tax=Streptomyces regalis TaxID=68262 RepID=A0A101JFE5_9ACTN|nr:HAD-IIIA family hydrolase [Streptomyces regalis]KUL25739.1 hypothetical protein ADL12_34080 [Streptomyces regalis]